jgi:hypothetical protein
MLVEILPDLTINVDKVHVIKMVEETDKYDEPHVLIDFGQNYLELDPEITMQQVCMAIDNERKNHDRTRT